MTIDISQDPKTGSWKFSYSRHVFVALGLLLVTGGLATLSGPWWQSIANSLLGKVGIVVNDRYQWTIAASQIIPGISLLSYKHFILDKNTKKVLADRKSIALSGLDFNDLRYFLKDLLDDHSYHSNFNLKFQHALTFFSQPENSFQTSPVANSFNSFKDAGKKLQLFLAGNFYVFPDFPSSDGQYKYCLAPHMNIDREMLRHDTGKIAEYNRLQGILHNLVDETSQLLAKWIEKMKETGSI